jgi:hypothetical protein
MEGGVVLLVVFNRVHAAFSSCHMFVVVQKGCEARLVAFFGFKWQ